MPQASSVCDTEPPLWYGVTDPRTRKRIQDRLAQRARRKRLSEAAKQLENSPATSTAVDTKTRQKATRKKTKHDKQLSSFLKTTEDEDTETTQALALWSECPASFLDLQTTELSTTTCESNNSMRFKSSPRSSKSSSIYLDRSVSQNLEIVTATPAPSLSDPQPLPEQISFVMALEVCGTALGIIGCNVGFMKSRRQQPNVPEALQPSPLQLSTAHFIWIDRLPFPRLRDNLILLSNVIDLDEFLQDGLHMEAFHLDKGALPWDPQRWRITPQFREKWGYLLL